MLVRNQLRRELNLYTRTLRLAEQDLRNIEEELQNSVANRIFLLRIYSYRKTSVNCYLEIIRQIKKDLSTIID